MALKEMSRRLDHCSASSQKFLRLGLSSRFQTPLIRAEAVHEAFEVVQVVLLRTGSTGHEGLLCDLCGNPLKT